MVETNTKANKESLSSFIDSKCIKTHMNSKMNWNVTKQAYIKSHPFKKSLNLQIYHQNIRGIYNKTDELLSQWDSQTPHVLCFTEHDLTKAEIIRTSINHYNLGAYFCRKFRKSGGVSIFVQHNL
jgi:hypothetical protein